MGFDSLGNRSVLSLGFEIVDGTPFLEYQSVRAMFGICGDINIKTTQFVSVGINKMNLRNYK